MKTRARLLRSTRNRSVAAIAAGRAVRLAQAQKVAQVHPAGRSADPRPITTTAYITRNHGYMIYDTLFATDAKFQVQPQMVDKYELSAIKLTYTFTLRDGLKFHDGQPVRSADCIASIERWAKRDALGQKLAEVTDSWKAVNDKTFTLKLKRPFPARARSAREAVVERAVHHARAHRQDRRVDEHHRADRLGPFKFVKGGVGAREQGRLREEHRLRAAQGAAVVGGGRQSRRRSTASSGSTSRTRHGRGRAQRRRSRLVGADAARLIPVLAKNKDIKVENIDPLGSMGMIRFNFMYPPFNNAKMRQAVLYAIDQNDYVIGIAGDKKNGHTCYSYFTCGTPLSSEVGAEPMKASATSTRRSSSSRKPATTARRSSSFRRPISRSSIRRRC
jgi:peptide/nickel transport system substrate-binding protein